MAKEVGISDSFIPDKEKYAIVYGFVPVILLQLLIGLIPGAIRGWSLGFAGVKTRTAADSYALLFSFGFHMANVWLNLIGGSLCFECAVHASCACADTDED